MSVICTQHFKGDLRKSGKSNESEGGALILFWIVILQLAEIEEHTATSMKIYTQGEWDKKVYDVKIRKEDMNKLVMNFLLTEGLLEAAENFKLESGTEHIDLATVRARMAVVKAVQDGNIQEAIERLNAINPEMLDTNPTVCFHLQLQHFIELIRNEQVGDALKFARSELAPKTQTNQNFEGEFKRAVGLVLFEKHDDHPLKDLIDISHRYKTATEVNAAILTTQSGGKDTKAKLEYYLKMWQAHRIYLRNFIKLWQPKRKRESS